jgi:hypothetical protein
MTGAFDLAIDVCCREVDHLHKFVTQQLRKIEGVRETLTSILLPDSQSPGPTGSSLAVVDERMTHETRVPRRECRKDEGLFETE